MIAEKKKLYQVFWRDEEDLCNSTLADCYNIFDAIKRVQSDDRCKVIYRVDLIEE